MRLRYTLEAARELERVLADIAEQSSQGARRVRLRIRKAVDLLIEYPRSGQTTSRRDLRRIVATPYPYVIFYLLSEGEVVVIGIRHAARNPSSMPDQT